MDNVSVLDCTLREAPLENLMWGTLSLRKTIRELAEAKIEYVECGFLKDIEYIEGSAYFNTVDNIKQAIGEKRKNVIYAALVDYGRYDLSQLSENDGTSVDLIRICFKKNEINKVLAYAEDIQKKGYLVSIQHVNTIGYTDEEIITFIERVNEIHPYAYAIVDTFGSMYADDALRLCKLADEYLADDIALGFHAHNNLMMANSNCQTIIQEANPERKIIVDSSLFGCGRGAGNANTELVAEYLNKKCGYDYDIDGLLDIIDTVINAAKQKTKWGYSIPNFIAGMNDAHSFNVQFLTKQHNIKSADLRAIIRNLDSEQKKKYDFELLERKYYEYFDNPVDDKSMIEEIKQKISGCSILLLAPGKNVDLEGEKVLQCIDRQSPFVIGVNNYFPNYKMDMIFYSGIRRYKLLPYLDLKAVGNPTIIKTSNIKEKIMLDEMVVDYGGLMKPGWTYMDSSIILLLRLLAKCGANDIYIAGLDGYKKKGEAFMDDELETALSIGERQQATRENQQMLDDLRLDYPTIKIRFVTSTVYK